MARTKGTAKTTAVSSVKKARKLQAATEYTRKTRLRYAIPPAAFGRVVRFILEHHGKDQHVTKISPKAVDVLQRFVEQNVVAQLDKARLIMGPGKRTLLFDHLRVAEIACSVGSIAQMATTL